MSMDVLMSVFVYYEIKEVKSCGEVTCFRRSKDPFMILSDFLAKVKNPVTGHKNKAAWACNVQVQNFPRSSSYKSKAVFSFVLIMYDKDTKEKILSIDVSTRVSNKELPCGFDKVTYKSYRSDGSLRAVSKLRNRMIEWSKSDLDVCRTLALFASANPDHIFWNEETHIDKDVLLVRSFS